MWASTTQVVQSLFSVGPSRQSTPSTGVEAEFIFENVILIMFGARACGDGRIEGSHSWPQFDLSIPQLLRTSVSNFFPENFQELLCFFSTEHKHKADLTIPGIDHVIERDLNVDREPSRKLKGYEVFQFWKVSVPRAHQLNDWKQLFLKTFGNV